MAHASSLTMGNAHKVMKRTKRDLEERASCTSLYLYPTSTDTVPAFTDVTFKWDPNCLVGITNADLYLYTTQPSKAVHEWRSVPFTGGSLTTQLNAAWWNSSSTTTLQLIIVQSGSPLWDTSAPSGPYFQATFNGQLPASVTASTPAATATGPSVETVSGDVGTGSGVTGGKLAAAIVVPLLAVLVVVAAYVIFSRVRGKKDRKRWSAYVDQRMSVISGATWQQQYPRPSMASARPSAGGDRSSMFDNGRRARQSTAGSIAHPDAYGRPKSTYSRASRAMGVGHLSRPQSTAQGFNLPPGLGEPNREMIQQRMSRISFVPSAADRHSRYSSNNGPPPSPNRPYGHQQHASSLSAPMGTPRRPSFDERFAEYRPEDDDLAMSPDQHDGPSPLNSDTAVQHGLRAHQQQRSSVTSSLQHDIAGLASVSVIRGDGHLPNDSEDEAEEFASHQVGEDSDDEDEDDADTDTEEPTVQGHGMVIEQRIGGRSPVQNQSYAPSSPTYRGGAGTPSTFSSSRAEAENDGMPRFVAESVLTPDDALRAYAAGRNNPPSSNARSPSPRFPSSVTSPQVASQESGNADAITFTPSLLSPDTRANGSPPTLSTPNSRLLLAPSGQSGNRTSTASVMTDGSRYSIASQPRAASNGLGLVTEEEREAGYIGFAQ